MTTLTIPAGTLARIATVCLPHTGRDELLPVFCCVRLFERDGHLYGEATDRYTLGYEHVDDGMRWHLVEGRLQTAQDAAYSLVALDDARTEVTFALTFSHNLPLPGFVRSRVIKGLAGSTTSGLADRLR